MFATALPASLDALKLRAEIAAALAGGGWTHPGARGAALGRLRAAQVEGRKQALSRLSDDSGGLEAARLLSGVMNAVLRALYDALAEADPAGAQGVSLLALGGYGAGELAPGSDADLLILKPDGAGSDQNRFIETLNYALWDAGVPVGGGAARTLEETLELARADVSERTSLLSMRLVAGEPGLAAALETAFRAEARKGGGADFVEAKLRERDARVARAGRSRYTVEPNIKDGKGGLRDLQMLRWLAQYLYGADAFERWVTGGLLTVADIEKYLKAADFLWTLRFHLHDLSGGKDDRLTFDLQPEIAARMGFADSETEIAAEKLMRRYFLTAMDVGALTRLVCAKLEADEWKSRPRGLARFMPAGRAAGADDEDFTLRDGRLDFTDAGRIEDEPVLMMRLFEAAAARGADLHPDAIAAVGRNLRLIDDDFRTDVRAARALFAILLDADEPHLVLRLMIEAGLLGRYIPEFGAVVARTQFNMYHRYTVDEHTLNALGLLRDIERGRETAEHPLASQLAPQVKNRRALHLAVLLHDTGKGAGDQCVEGAKRAETACARLGLDEEETALVAWLVRSHLMMSDAAQRRDLSDPRTVIDFARAAGSLERLRLLLILTVVDIRAVGPGVWNGWKAQLLRDLYAAAAAVLAEGAEGGEREARARLAERAALARALLSGALRRVDAAFAERWTEDLDDAYWLAFTAADRLRHAAVARAAYARGAAVATAARIDRRRAAAEVIVMAPDRDRLFADIAGALADLGANIVGAHVATTRSGAAFDVFFVQDASGAPFGESRPRALDALLERVRRAAEGRAARRLRRAEAELKRREAAFAVSPQVVVDNSAAETATVIEATGRDRPGLLADLAAAISGEGLSISAARIDGYGERAVDVFYVLKNGRKLTSKSAIGRVRDRLLAVLGEDEAAFAEQARVHGLARATSRAAR
ncbi:MAG: [protein-PII] uridylyltransferase [Maricaulaceae bacterium]|nr:[protein-PII] uridylyltransferase [Maricaulaceae bacterium]